MLDPDLATRLKRNDDGLVAAIAQDAGTGRVLMQAWMNDQALEQTLATRQATYWSRSRDELWVKGLTSGHTQHVREVRLDCDGDSVLLLVDQTGAACHTGRSTCFDADLLLADDRAAADTDAPGEDAPGEDAARPDDPVLLHPADETTPLHHSDAGATS